MRAATWEIRLRGERREFVALLAAYADGAFACHQA
jgi:hypothetical protein